MNKIGRRKLVSVGYYLDVNHKAMIESADLPKDWIEQRLLRGLYRGIPIRWTPTTQMTVLRTAEMPIIEKFQTRYVILGTCEVAYIGRRRVVRGRPGR